MTYNRKGQLGLACISRGRTMPGPAKPEVPVLVLSQANRDQLARLVRRTTVTEPLKIRVTPPANPKK